MPGADLNACAGRIHLLGRALVNVYPLPNYNDPTNRHNCVRNENLPDLFGEWPDRGAESGLIAVRLALLGLAANT